MHGVNFSMVNCISKLASYVMPVVSAPLSFYKIGYYVCIIILIWMKAFIFIHSFSEEKKLKCY